LILNQCAFGANSASLDGAADTPFQIATRRDMDRAAPWRAGAVAKAASPDVKRVAQADSFSHRPRSGRSPFARSKNFKKSEKKACQLSGSSINEGKLGDKAADFPFKNILKKVKKKLVSLSNIQ